MEIGELELHLSLSLNGRRGSDLQRPKDNLTRSSSSLSLMLNVPAANEAEECSGGSTARIAKRCWWPAVHGAEEEEDEEEKGRKKRKELQSLRRMEVKKRRMEKQRSVNGKSHARGRRPWTGRRFRCRRALDSDLSRSRGWGGGSSGVSAGSNSQQASAVALPPVLRKRSNDVKSSAEQTLRSVLEDMPCVCAKVNGQNSGRVVEGFLFRYRKGEEIKIVCICHGRFLSPAEFIEHAGGSRTDVAHPLKRIVVCPPSW